MEKIITLQEHIDKIDCNFDIVLYCLSLDTDNINEEEVLCKIC